MTTAGSTASAVITGPNRSTQTEGYVKIEVPLEGPYGVRLESDKDGRGATIKAWERGAGGRLGPIQKHGGIRIGDVLLSINDYDCTEVSFDSVLSKLNCRNTLRKVLVFGSQTYYRRMLERKKGPGDKAVNGSIFKSGPGFDSFVKQARVQRDNSSNAYAEYEVVCSMRVSTSKVHKQSTLKWSVWRRFSEFERLDIALRSTLGWQLNGIKFPPKNSLTFNKLSLDFVESRRQQLEVYWKGVMGVERIHEFHKHYSSDELKRFLDVTNILANRSTEAAQAPQNNEEDNSALTGQVNTEDDNENEAAGDSGLKGNDAVPANAVGQPAAAPAAVTAKQQRGGQRRMNGARRRQTLSAARRASNISNMSSTKTQSTAKPLAIADTPANKQPSDSSPVATTTTATGGRRANAPPPAQQPAQPAQFPNKTQETTAQRQPAPPAGPPRNALFDSIKSLRKE